MRTLTSELHVVARRQGSRRWQSAMALRMDHQQVESSHQASGKARARTLESDGDASDLFEPANSEYDQAKHKLSHQSAVFASDAQALLHHAVALLDLGQEGKADDLVRQSPHLDLPESLALENAAAQLLADGHPHAFLRWWKYSPGVDTVLGSRDEIAARIKQDVHHLERLLLAQPNTGDRLDLLQQFALMAASKGKAAHVTWTLQELAMFLPKGSLRPFFQSFKTAALKHAKSISESSWSLSDGARASARVYLEHLQAKLIARRARAGFVAEAAVWLIDVKTARTQPWHSRLPLQCLTSVIRSVEAMLHRLPPQDSTASELQQLLPHLRGLLKSYAPRKLLHYHQSQDEGLLLVPGAPLLSLSGHVVDRADEGGSDGLGMEAVQALGLAESTGAIAQVAEWRGVRAFSAGTLAGYIHVLQAANPDSTHRHSNDTLDLSQLRPWDEIGVEKLDPNVTNIAKSLWTTALMLYQLKHTSPSHAINVFSNQCLPFGAPSLLVSHMRLMSAEQHYRTPVWPSRFCVTVLWRALVAQAQYKSVGESIFQDVEEAYLAFQATFYGPHPCPIELLPDSVLFQPFLEAFAEQTRPYRCLQVLVDMHKHGVKPDAHNWAPVLGALAKQPDPSTIFTVLNKMEDSSFDVPAELAEQNPDIAALLEDVPAPTVATYATLIKGFAMRALPTLSRQVQQWMEVRMSGEELEWHWSKNTKLRAAVDLVEKVEGDVRMVAKSAYTKKVQQ